MASFAKTTVFVDDDNKIVGTGSNCSAVNASSDNTPGEGDAAAAAAAIGRSSKGTSNLLLHQLDERSMFNEPKVYPFDVKFGSCCILGGKVGCSFRSSRGVKFGGGGGGVLDGTACSSTPITLVGLC